MKYFGTDGIRGRVNSENINGDMFFKFGLAAGKYFTNLKKKKQTAIIAKDTRLSGYTLEPALVSGLASLYLRTTTYKWSCNVNKINECQPWYYDYSIT